MTEMFNLPKEDRTLANYTKEAMSIIGRWGQPWMLKDEDVIANVINAIIRAEYDYDPSRGTQRSTLRITYGRYQIMGEFRHLKRLSKRPIHVSIEADRFNEEGKSFSGDIGHVEDYRSPYTPDLEAREKTDGMKKTVSKMLKSKHLTKKQRRYLKLHYLKGKTVNQLADKFKCSKQAVHQVVQGGIRQLKSECVSA